MNKINYDAALQDIIEENLRLNKRPKLLLHSCCAPCSSTCIERLKDAFDLTVFYYNPNIDTEAEYLLRAKEQQRLCENLNVKTVVTDHLSEEFYAQVSGLEGEPEGGARCIKCFNLRLNKTAQFAKEHSFDFFATTLTLSPLKNSERINGIGKAVGEKIGVKYLPSDFKKRNGYLRSIELSKTYSLYRQNYCGCEFSKK